MLENKTPSQVSSFRAKSCVQIDHTLVMYTVFVNRARVLLLFIFRIHRVRSIVTVCLPQLHGLTIYCVFVLLSNVYSLNFLDYSINIFHLYKTRLPLFLRIKNKIKFVRVQGYVNQTRRKF